MSVILQIGETERHTQRERDQGGGSVRSAPACPVKPRCADQGAHNKRNVAPRYMGDAEARISVAYEAGSPTFIMMLRSSSPSMLPSSLWSNNEKAAATEASSAGFAILWAISAVNLSTGRCGAHEEREKVGSFEPCCRGSTVGTANALVEINLARAVGVSDAYHLFDLIVRRHVTHRVKQVFEL